MRHATCAPHSVHILRFNLSGRVANTRSILFRKKDLFRALFSYFNVQRYANDTAENEQTVSFGMNEAQCDTISVEEIP